jgi:hypothetical protein
MLIFEGLMPSHLAKKLMQALLALLSTGGEVLNVFLKHRYIPLLLRFSMTGVVLLQRNGFYYRRA